MDQKKVFMLGAGPLQVPAITELKKMGAYVICLDYNPEAIGFEYADESRIISTVDVEAICGEMKEEKDAVLMTSTSDAPVRVISDVSKRLGLLCDLSYEDACAVTIKSVMRQRLKENHVPIPQYVVIEKEEDLKTAYYKTFSQECIIKPSDSAGSRGVKLLAQGLNEGQIEQEYQLCKAASRNGVIVAEEVMTGPEVSVESLTVNGITDILTITDKVVCERPYFVEIGHKEPSSLPDDMKNKIMNVTRQAIAAMNITNSPSHTEVMVTKDGPKIVEIAARLGGDFITSRLVPLSTGINMVKESVKMALHEPVCYERGKQMGAAIRFISADSKGKVTNISGIEEAKKMPGVYEVVVETKVGEQVAPLHSSNDRIGHVIATGKDTKEAWERAEAAFKKISVITQDE